MNYSYTKKINYSFLEALDEVRIVFSENGFGVVSNIDLSEKIRTKIDLNFGEYRILGVCKPDLAYKFLSEKMDLGVFMPCSVAIYEKSDGVYVSVGLPNGMLPSTVSNKELLDISENLTDELKKIVNKI